MNMPVHSASELRIFTVAIPALLALGACGGGAPGDSTDMVVSQLPITGGNIMPPRPDTGNGIWWQLNSADQIHAGCIITDSGELGCLVFEPGSLDITGALHGTLQPLALNSFTASGTMYATPGTTLADGVSTAADFTITEARLTHDVPFPHFTWTINSLGEAHTWNLVYDHYYLLNLPGQPGVGSSSSVFGVYPEFDLFGVPASFSVDDSGSLFSQTAAGCTGNGLMQLVNPAHNAWTADVALAGCPGLDGAYQGLASLIDYQWVNGYDVLMIAVFNEDGFAAGIARK